MNWLIIRSMKIRPDRPAKVLVIAVMTSLLLWMVFAPMPKQTPHVRNVSVIRKIRLAMNGVVPMILPVSASRNGAHDGSVRMRITASAPRKP